MEMYVQEVEREAHNNQATAVSLRGEKDQVRPLPMLYNEGPIAKK